MSNQHIVVIGAGPAGLSAAWQLAKRGIAVDVIERDNMVGGLAKTISYDDQFYFDYGPHTLHIRETDESRRVVSEVRALMGENVRVLQRGTRLYLKNRYFTYPPQLREVMRKISVGLAWRIAIDYVYASLRYAFNPANEEDSFEDWGIRNLGRTLYNIFFGVYSEKVWGIPMSRVSSRQAQRVAKLNLKNMLLRMFRIKTDPETYFIEYLYPYGGICGLYNRMAEETEAYGGTVHLNATATRIETDGQHVQAVVYEQDGEEYTLPCTGLVSTLPLIEAVPMFHPAFPADIQAAAAKLSYRSLCLVYLIVNRAKATDYHWCYLIEPQFLCNRVSEQKNVAPDMLPEDRTVLCVEISCDYDDARWRAPDETLVQMAIDDMVRVGSICADEVADYAVVRLRYAYPIYKLGFEKVLFTVLDSLYQFENLVTIGRHGLFLNNSMDDNVWLGLRVAEYIAQNGAHNDDWWREVQEYMRLRPSIEGVQQ